MDPGAGINEGAAVDNESPEHVGEDTITVLGGGFSTSHAHAKRHGQSEETPLLGGVRSDGMDTQDGQTSTHWLGQDDFVGLPWWKRPSPSFLLPPFFLFTLAFGGMFVLKFQLQQDLICRDYYSELTLVDPAVHVPPVDFNRENYQCDTDEVQRRLTAFTTASSLISGLLSAIVSPKLGALSDRYGRKPILCLSSIGMLMMEIMTVVAAAVPDKFPTNLLLLSFVFDGLVGSFTSGMAVAFAYSADCTPPIHRHTVFAQYHGSFFAGIAIGPLISAYVTKATGTPLTMFSAVIVCHVLFLLMVIFIAPESLSKRRQLLAREKHAEEKATYSTSEKTTMSRLRKLNILEPLKILWPTGEGSSRAVRVNLLLLCSIDTLVFGVAMGMMNILMAYQSKMFHWDQFNKNIFMAIVNTCRVTGLFVILPLITRIVRGKVVPLIGGQPGASTGGASALDLGIIRVAILFDIFGFLGYALARQGSLFTLSGSIASIGGMASPLLGSAVTKHIPPEQTGQVLGAQGLLHAIVRVVSPIIFGAIYYKTVGTHPQAIWICLCSLFGLAFLLSWGLRKGLYVKSSDELADPAQLTPGVSEGRPRGATGRD